MFTLLMLAGCGDGESAPDASRGDAVHRPPGAYAADPELEPEETARAYVEALDEHDGRRFCGLVAPYISGRYDLATRDPDSHLRSLRGCPGFVSAFIGYVEDCCPPEFKAAKVEAAHDARPRGDLRAVDLTIRLEVLEDGAVHVERLSDRVWLARLDGAWRVAKLSAVARAASLPMPRFDDEQADTAGADDDPVEAPDVAEEQRLFAAAVADSRRRGEQREASYGKVGAAADCSGGLSVDDAEGDQDWNGSGPPEDPPQVQAGDIRKVSVVVRGKQVCVRWELAGAPEAPLALKYGHRKGPTTGQFFDVELREDGTARVTSGEDDEGRPIPVPAQVGAGRTAVTMLLNPRSFPAGQAPPLRDFGISAGSVAIAGDQRSVLDQLGSEPSATFRYTDGEVCELDGC